MDYDGSDTAKDKVKRMNITLNEKLAAIKALDESILAAINERNLEAEIKESDEFCPRIYGNKHFGIRSHLRYLGTLP